MPLFLVGKSHEWVALSGGGSGGSPLFERLHIEVFRNYSGVLSGELDGGGVAG